MRNDDFLYPRDLEVTESGIKNVLLIGYCFAEHFGLMFRAQNPNINFEYILRHNAGVLPERNSQSSYDFTFLHLPANSIFDYRLFRIADADDQTKARYKQDAFDAIDQFLETGLKYNNIYGELTFVFNFIVPQRSTSISLSDDGDEHDLRAVVADANRYLRDRLKLYKNVYIADIDAIASSIGKQYVLDDATWLYNHLGFAFPTAAQENVADWALPERCRIEEIPPVCDYYPNRIGEFVRTVFRQAESAYRSIRQIDQVKLVVFDLDNTLWRGQIAQHYDDGRVYPPLDGWPTGIWEAIHHLRARGILVAICSKNDEEVVLSRWARPILFGWLKPEDFIIRKINWEAKAQNIAEIIGELNLTPGSTLFVDDNPVERASVKDALPDIRVIGANPLTIRRILLWSPETRLATVTPESSRREKMMRGQIERNATRGTKTREEFLQGLGCTVAIRSIQNLEDVSFARVIELLNKTNQFNTTGRLWSIQEFTAFMKDGGRAIAFTVADKFTSYGIVGVLLIRDDLIDQFVMSCRVLGLDIEASVITLLLRHQRRRGITPMRTPVVATSDNTVCRDIYLRAGFQPSGSVRETTWYVSADERALAEHLTFELDQEFADLLVPTTADIASV